MVGLYKFSSYHSIQKITCYYICSRVKNFNNQIPRPLSHQKGFLNPFDLLYRIPVNRVSIDGLNRAFEELIRNNEQLWCDLLGRCSKNLKNQQAEAAGLLLRNVVELQVNTSPMLSYLFACGFLQWLYNSTPYTFDATERWEHITQFIADVHGYLCRYKSTEVYHEMAFGMPKDPYWGMEICICSIALNLINIENLLHSNLSEEDLAQMTIKLRRTLRSREYEVPLSKDNQAIFFSCAMMLYHTIAYTAFDYIELPARTEISQIQDYIYHVVK